LVALALLASCADLKSIRQFANTSADAAGWTSLSEDYVKSIARIQRYEEGKAGDALASAAARRQAQQPALRALHHGVEAYLKVLGALAADDLAASDVSLAALAGSLHSANLLADTQSVAAFTSLTELIAKAATDGYRQRQLTRLIAQANPDFQTVIAALAGIVERDFTAALEIESAAADKYYRAILITAEQAPPQQAALALVREKWREKKDALDAKKQACALYAQTLKKIGEGHQLLYDRRGRLAAQPLLATIARYQQDVAGLYAQMKAIE